MTERAQPGAQGSTLRNVEIGEAGGSLSDGFIVPSSEPTLSAQRFNALDETQFNEFEASWSASSYDVTVDPGEAFVKGWLATDETYTVTLDGFTDNQTVVVAWDADAVYDDSIHSDREDADRVIVTREADLPTLDVPYIPIWEFDTDGNGVTAAIDRRKVGRHAEVKSVNTENATINSRQEPPTYATVDDVPTDMREGGFVWVEDEQRYVYEDGQ